MEATAGHCAPRKSATATLSWGESNLPHPSAFSWKPREKHCNNLECMYTSLLHHHPWKLYEKHCNHLERIYTIEELLPL